MGLYTSKVSEKGEKIVKPKKPRAKKEKPEVILEEEGEKEIETKVEAVAEVQPQEPEKPQEPVIVKQVTPEPEKIPKEKKPLKKVKVLKESVKKEKPAKKVKEVTPQWATEILEKLSTKDKINLFNTTEPGTGRLKLDNYGGQGPKAWTGNGASEDIKQSTLFQQVFGP